MGSSGHFSLGLEFFCRQVFGKLEIYLFDSLPKDAVGITTNQREYYFSILNQSKMNNHPDFTFGRFAELPPSSRIWIYQSKDPLGASTSKDICVALEDFFAGWTSHGRKVNAGGAIYHNHFVIIAVDESDFGTSGCGIDKSTEVIRRINSRFGIDLFDRMHIPLYREGSIQWIHFSELDSLISSASLDAGTEVFDQTISSLDVLKSDWVRPMSATWLSRFLPEGSISNAPHSEN